jgi:hypothetical protein
MHIVEAKASCPGKFKLVSCFCRHARNLDENWSFSQAYIWCAARYSIHTNTCTHLLVSGLGLFAIKPSLLCAAASQQPSLCSPVFGCRSSTSILFRC